MSSHSPNTFVGMLEHNPDVACWVGAFLADFAALEFWIVKLAALAFKEGDDMPMAHSICGRVRNLTDRAELVKDCVARSALPPEIKLLATGFINEILAINVKRNEYAHGLYEINLDTKAVRLTTWATTTARKSKIYDPLTAEQIKDDVLVIRRLSGRIVKAILPEEVTALPDATALPSKS